MIATLETKRLILRPLRLADADRTQQLFPHWEIVKHLAARFPWPFPPDGTLTYYRDMALPAMGRGEEWHWTLRLKTEPDEHIGCISLRKGATGNRGFWLGLPWHRQGLMSEAVDVVNDYWFDSLGFAEMCVQKAIASTASRRISEKNGMRLIGTTESDYISGRLPTEIWTITAEDWRRHRATP
jgi:[ribosomal protein S5]-alanine N-acetyltransferase